MVFPMGILLSSFGRGRVQEHSHTSRGYVFLGFGFAAVLLCLIDVSVCFCQAITHDIVVALHSSCISHQKHCIVVAFSAEFGSCLLNVPILVTVCYRNCFLLMQLFLSPQVAFPATPHAVHNFFSCFPRCFPPRSAVSEMVPLV